MSHPTWDACHYDETYNHGQDLTTEMSTDLDSFTMTEKEGLYKAVFSRRDVRSHFIGKQIPDDILVKVLNAAHTPHLWDFHNPGILY